MKAEGNVKKSLQYIINVTSSSEFCYKLEKTHLEVVKILIKSIFLDLAQIKTMVLSDFTRNILSKSILSKYWKLNYMYISVEKLFGVTFFHSV